MRAITYRDILPQETVRGGLFAGVDFSEFDTCIVAMNEWLAEAGVELIRLETVVLPNLHNEQEDGTTDTELHATGHTV